MSPKRAELHVLDGSGGALLGVSFSPDGKTVAAASQDQSARLWDSTSFQLIRTFAGHSGAVTSVCFAPDGKTLATGSLDRSVRLWEVSTGNSLRTLNGEDEVYGVRFSRDGNTLACAIAR